MISCEATPSTAAHRRVLRYSVRALLLAMTIMAGGFTWVAILIRERHNEDRAIQFISSKLETSPNLGFGSPFGDDDGFGDTFYQGTPDWLTRALGVDLLRALTGVQCYAPGNKFSYRNDTNGRLQIDRDYNSGLTDSDLETLAQLHHLRHLHLEAHPVTDSGALHLASLSELRVLNLGNTAISNEAIKVLSHLRRLRELNVSRTDVTDECLVFLAKCPTLQKLDVTMTNVSQVAIETFQGNSPNCEVKR